MIDTSALPVVDVHCHPFLNKGEVSSEQFTNAVSFGGGSREYMAAGGVTVDDDLIGELQRIKRDVLYFRYLVHQLAAFFNCPPNLDHVLAERNKAVSEDYTGYVKRLFSDCVLTTLVTDFGYPQPPVAISQFIKEIPVQIVPIYRIEPLIVTSIDMPFGTRSFLLVLNRQVYDRLAQEAKDALAKYGGEPLSRKFGKIFDDADKAMVEAAMKNPKKVVINADKAALAALEKKFKPFHDAWIRENRDGQKKYDALRRILAELRKGS